ncbi:RnfABCDGE type electron transport complex subunit D [Desulfococcaceae bacterium HSG8]|nr:RnfABCDGE type electron transport complex subunit D [Desulfococcaceae bacterium HSG8]
MLSQKKFIVSHAPFWHNGSSISEQSYNIIFAALPAVIAGICYYGTGALAVVAMAVSTAILWELAFNLVAKRPISIGDGNAAVIGLVFAMLMPAATPWWVVVTGTFIAIVVGKQIFGGIGGNPFHPVAVAIAIMMLSWKNCFDFDHALMGYELDFPMIIYPLAALKNFGVSAVEGLTAADLIMGKQVGGIGATFGLGLIIGGFYLIIRGFIRWEISVSFLLGLVVTAFLFNMSDPSKYASPIFHLFTGYTLIGAFFLATEDSSSPVNCVPMLLYGALGGVMTVLIRNIGVYVDGVIFAILIINLLNPLLDKIRPKAMGA